MITRRCNYLFLLALLVLMPSVVQAQDYVRLKQGRVVECAILRMDSLAIFATEWSQRNLRHPQLQVFAKEEVASVSFGRVGQVEAVSHPYLPASNLLEGGAALAFQTWADSQTERRYLLQLSLQAAYSLIPQLGFEVNGDFTIPTGSKTDTVWYDYDTGYQLTMNVFVQPFEWNGSVPFALVGGGASVGLPLDRLLLPDETDVRNVVNVGLGVKYGRGHIGYRLEWRHYFYTWTPNTFTEDGVRVNEQTADLSVIRAGIFLFR